MHIFIQNPSSRQFIDEQWHWTADIKQGRPFGSPEDAMQGCHDHQLDNYQLLLRFYSPNFETILSRKDVEQLPKWMRHRWLSLLLARTRPSPGSFGRHPAHYSQSARL